MHINSANKYDINKANTGRDGAPVFTLDDLPHLFGKSKRQQRRERNARDKRQRGFRY